MTFNFTEKGRTKVNTVYHISDAAGDIIGSINCPRGQEADLLSHWRGAQAPGTPAGTRRGGARRQT